MDLPEDAPEWLHRTAKLAQGKVAQADIEGRAMSAEYDEMFLTMNPRHLYLVMGLVAMASAHPDLGNIKSGEMYAILKHVHGVDPESGHPYGHDILGGEST